MGLIKTLTYSQGSSFNGNEIKLITLLDGQQTFLFYTTGVNSQSFGVVEIIIDEKLKDDGSQLVIDYGELGVPLPDAQNFGPLHLGGGDNKMLAFFHKFNAIKGYAMCAYNEIIQGSASTSCDALLKGTYLLDPFRSHIATCDKVQSVPEMQ